LAAYDLHEEGDPTNFVPPAGYNLISKIYADDITNDPVAATVFGFIAQSDSDVVVAIRGTEGVLEWLLDFEFALVPFPYLSAGNVEAGFNDCYSSFRTGKADAAPRVVDALARVIAGGTAETLLIAGHSLGAALATLLAIDLAANGGFAAPVVYTFASPRVGDKVFAGTYGSLIQTSWRIANRRDIVPSLPPESLGYVHVKTEYEIDSADRCKQNVRCWHALETYLNTLDPSVALQPQCVPRPKP
jgi:predicted lipase